MAYLDMRCGYCGKKTVRLVRDGKIYYCDSCKWSARVVGKPPSYVRDDVVSKPPEPPRSGGSPPKTNSTSNEIVLYDPNYKSRKSLGSRIRNALGSPDKVPALGGPDDVLAAKVDREDCEDG